MHRNYLGSRSPGKWSFFFIVDTKSDSGLVSNYYPPVLKELLCSGSPSWRRPPLPPPPSSCSYLLQPSRFHTGSHPVPTLQPSLTSVSTHPHHPVLILCTYPLSYSIFQVIIVLWVFPVNPDTCPNRSAPQRVQ